MKPIESIRVIKTDIITGHIKYKVQCTNGYWVVAWFANDFANLEKYCKNNLLYFGEIKNHKSKRV
jgi:hypothetical protein